MAAQDLGPASAGPSTLCDLCGSRTPGYRWNVPYGAGRVLTIGECCLDRVEHWPPSTVAPPRPAYGDGGEQLALIDTLPYKTRSAGWREDLWRAWRQRVGP
jgi:hypothetical protein